MKTQGIRERCGGAWVARPGGWWQALELGRLLAVAAEMKAGGARFASLTVRPAAGMLKLAWHWDFQGTLMSVEGTSAPATPIPSLAEFWPCTDWAEREARDYYAVTFTGRESTPPLMLRDGDTPGVLLPGKEGKSS